MADDPTTDDLTCVACGARLTPGQTRCDLCGHAVGQPPPDAEIPATVAAAPAAGGVPAEGDGVFCNACGWKNPDGARFCSRCGSALQADAAAPALPPGTPEPDADAPRRAPEPEGIGSRLGLLVGASVLLVAALYALTVALDRPSAAPEPAPAPAAAPDEPLPQGSVTGVFAPLSDEATRRISALEDELDAAPDAERAAVQRRLVDLLIGYGRPDLAAQAQSDLARETDDPIAYGRAGDLYYQWLNLLDENSRAPIATRAVAMYEQAREGGAADRDLRARQAWAVQYDPSSNPMRAIEESRAILDEDSLHVGANFNLGWMNYRVGRPAGARSYFERVVRTAGEDSPLGRNAAAIIETIDASGAAGQPDAPLPGQGATQ